MSTNLNLQCPGDSRSISTKIRQRRSDRKQWKRHARSPVFGAKTKSYRNLNHYSLICGISQYSKPKGYFSPISGMTAGLMALKWTPLHFSWPRKPLETLHGKARRGIASVVAQKRKWRYNVTTNFRRFWCKLCFSGPTPFLLTHTDVGEAY